MVGATSRLCWHDLDGTTVELAIEMHRQKKKAEAQGRAQEAHDATMQEEAEARMEFEKQRDAWMTSRSEGENHNMDTAADWTVAYGHGDG